MNFLRIIISIFVSIEMIFSSLPFGINFKTEMPEKMTGKFTRYVNPFIGTGGIPWACAMLSPAACVPFGCVRLGPDTCAVGGIASIKTNTSGYYYEHQHILGFSFGRLSGTGARDYGMFRVTPLVKGKKTSALPYSHKSEEASPGYYSVYLPTSGLLCEMTAGTHTGILRFSNITNSNSGVYIDASSCISSGQVDNPSIKMNSDRKTFTGEGTLFGTFTGRFDGLKVYIYGEFDKVPTSYEETGPGLKAIFQDKVFSLKAGISFVSVENAKDNLETESNDMSFYEIRSAAVEKWEDRLTRIDIEADEATKEIFYTALYHSMIMPTDFTDCNGEYIGFDKKIHTAEGFTYRTDMSLWDTCRNVHSLYALIAPDIQRDCIESLLKMAEQGGSLPRWPMGAGYSGSMFGNPADIVLTESYLKGFDFDAEKALTFMIEQADGIKGLDDTMQETNVLKEYKYLPDDIITRYSVSKTLEYCWEFDAVSRLALALGDEKKGEELREKSLYYKNLWDNETKYFRPKNSDGSWGRIITGITSFFDDIFGTDYFRAYCEGGARHWRWGAQHDVQGMIELFGTKEYFIKELENFMEDASRERAAIDPGSGFWIGNQHDIHTPYLFNDAGRSDLTQKWVRWTLSNRFSTDIDGLDGNDDGGTLSSWYLFSALGFYPKAGTEKYYIGSPAVDSAIVTLENGNTIRITAENNSSQNIYVSQVKFNDTEFKGTEFTHNQIIDGIEMSFEMSSNK